jgi:hypothetical protein
MDFKEPVHRGIPGDIPPNLRIVLEEIYRPKIESLQEYLGIKFKPLPQNLWVELASERCVAARSS